jgi:microcystin-dependent protein
MTQFARTTLDPNTHGGTFLADQINDWAGAVESSHQGASRPAYAVDGMIWCKTVSSTVVEIYYFDGTDDIKLGTVNPTANTFTPAGVSSGIPSGFIGSTAASSAPTGWLLCHGQAVSRATYADLFTAIGTQFGTGDGSTTFNLPDMRGRVAAGIDNMGGSAANRLTSTVMSPNGNTLGAVGGSQTHTLSTAEMPAHTHKIEPSTTVQSGAGASVRDNAGTPNVNTTSTGDGGAHNNTQPTMLLNAIIKT